MKIVVFSKDRAMQLDLCLNSLKKLAFEAEEMKAVILYQTTSYAHQDSYDALSYRYPFATFVKEKNFKDDLLTILQYTKEVMFLVDDNVFVKEFSIGECKKALDANLRTLGFSLRLGRNTRYCYPMQQEQTPPVFYSVAPRILMYRWVEAEYDFGYPLELSSSIYRRDDILPIIEYGDYNSPNTLESVMAYNTQYFKEQNPLLLCYEQSVAFCNPINKVQIFNNNRCGQNLAYSPDMLLKEFEKGGRIKFGNFYNFVPSAAHEEREIEIECSS